MNFGDLQEIVWRFMGLHASGQRRDHVLQQIKDDINWAHDMICRHKPVWMFDVRESSFDLVADTTTYRINDFAAKILDAWDQDTSQAPIPLVQSREADRDGSKNSNMSYLETGPVHGVVAYAKTASKQGAAGSVTEGSTAFTKTGGDSIASTDVGRRIKLNGEDMDFSVQAFVSADACTLGRSDDTSVTRAYRGRLTGVGTTGTGAGLSSKRWEISPPGTITISFYPTPTAAKTIYYRYVQRHARLLNTDDVPDINEEFHEPIASAAIARNAAFRQDWETYGVHNKRFSEAVERLKRQDDVSPNLQKRVYYSSPFGVRSRRQSIPRGTYYR